MVCRREKRLRTACREGNNGYNVKRKFLLFFYPVTPLVSYLRPHRVPTQVVFIPLINHLPAELEKIIPCKFNQNLVYTYMNWGNKLQHVLLSKVLSTFLNHCNIMVIDFVHAPRNMPQELISIRSSFTSRKFKLI